MQSGPDRLPGLLLDAGVTRREAEVFWMVGRRLHNREIAESLVLSERTVESHVSSLLRKLGGADRMSLVEVATRLRPVGASGTSLPRPLSSFVGRERELDDLEALVTQQRLVTLTGPAGAGKTRLALRVAEALESFQVPVLVDLVTVAPGADVTTAFAEAVGVVGDVSGRRRQIRAAFAEGRHWLVVDNCEHVSEGTADLLADLLGVCPGLTVLATSHGPLYVDGELVYEVEPLPLPPEDPDPSTVLASPAGRLFAERGATALPGFEVTSENAGDVATVVRGLDGLPLALELAAARLRVFSPAELRAHLHDRLGLLTGGSRGPAARHRTLEGALQWSYDLLESDEQLLLERCSVFPSGFDYDSVVGVASFAPLSGESVARLFPRLLDRSLLVARREGQATEYHMLDSIRQFAAARLAVRGEQPAVAHSHGWFHLLRAAATADELRGAGQAGALAWLDRRWPDLRRAMEWALGSDEVDAAWAFLGGIGTAWETVGARADLFDWLDTLTHRRLPDGTSGVHATVTAALLLNYHDVEQAHRMAEKSLELGEAEGIDQGTTALAHLALGWTVVHRQPQLAVQHLELAARSFRRGGDTWHLALSYQALGTARLEVDAALDDLARAVDLFGQVQDQVKRANCLNQLASVSVDARVRLGEVPGWLDEAARAAELSGSRHELIHAQLFGARLDVARGEPALAHPKFSSLLGEFRRIGDRRCVGRCLLGLGQAALAEGDDAGARRLLSECLRSADSTQDSLEIALALQGLAAVEHTGGDSRRAAELLGAAAAATAAINPMRAAGVDGAAARELGSALEHELGEDRFAEALAEGAANLEGALTDPAVLHT